MAITVRRNPQPLDSFDGLVKNAFDFFSVSIRGFSENPKYSAIHFYAAIELFLKARLMLEHWSLILDDPKRADRQRFLNGDFKSMTMEQAIERIKSICGEKLSDEHTRTFNSIRAHRNQFVHFFYPDGASNMEAIAKELCAAWYSLHQLLTGPWLFHFTNYESDIAEADEQMKSIRQFLAVKFDRLKTRLSQDQMNGITIHTCAACGYEACEIFDSSAPLFEYRCAVCDAHDRYLSLDCPVSECPGLVIVEDLIGASVTIAVKISRHRK